MLYVNDSKNYAGQFNRRRKFLDYVQSATALSGYEKYEK
jgi:hypothetical protein